jgi:integrase
MKPEVMAAHGGDLQDQLGHASLAATGIYLKVSPNQRKDAYMQLKLPTTPLSQSSTLMS